MPRSYAKPNAFRHFSNMTGDTMTDAEKVNAVGRLINLSYRCANYPDNKSIDRQHAAATKEVLRLVLGRRPTEAEMFGVFR